MLWDTDMLRMARRLKTENDNLSWNDVAEILEVDYSVNTTGNAVRKAVERFESRAETRQEQEYKYTLPEPTGRRFDTVVTLPNSTFCAMGDIHGDLYSRDLLLRAVDEMEYHGVSTLIIGGDLFNADELSTHPHNEKFTPFHKEMETVGSILAYLGNLPFLDTIVITSGNHDERITRKLNSYLSYQMVIHAALNGKRVTADIIATDLDYCYVNQSWVIGHLSNYSKVGGKIALDLARKHNRHAGVFHDHQQGIMADHRFIGVSIGAMLQKDAFFYKERRLNSYSDFQNGFLIVDDGMPILYNSEGTAPISGSIKWGDME
jgi:hypothetical protein